MKKNSGVYPGNCQTCLLFVLILLVTANYSCRKETSHRTGSHRLAFLSASTIRINQAVTIYDSTVISARDSFVISSFPVNRIYDWVITPATSCDTMLRHFKQGATELLFLCSGKYGVSANIYDSTTHQLLGVTDTLQVNVTKDTLYPAQAVQTDDELVVTPKVFPHFPPVPGTTVEFNFSTSKSYAYAAQFNQFVVTTHFDVGLLAWTFGDDILLSSYPYVWDDGTRSKVSAGTLVGGFGKGDVYGLSFTWLGVTHTGSMTVTTDTTLALSWDNSGAVKMVY